MAKQLFNIFFFYKSLNIIQTATDFENIFFLLHVKNKSLSRFFLTEQNKDHPLTLPPTTKR